jgi:hypothetical protein
MTYTILDRDGRYYARLPDGVEVYQRDGSCFETKEKLEEAMKKLAEEVAIAQAMSRV